MVGSPSSTTTTKAETQELLFVARRSFLERSAEPIQVKINSMDFIYCAAKSIQANIYFKSHMIIPQYGLVKFTLFKYANRIRSKVE